MKIKLFILKLHVWLINIVALGRPVIINWTFTNIDKSFTEHLLIDSKNDKALVARCKIYG